MKAKSAASRFASGVGTAVQAYQDVVNFSQAIVQGQFLKALVDRYCSLSLGYNRTTSHTVTETAVRPYIEAAVLNLTGDRATVLAGGIQAYIRDELNVDVPILKLKKATNRFLSQMQTTGMSAGFNLATRGHHNANEVTAEYPETTPAI